MKVKMKKVLKMLLGVVLGGAVGALGAMLIIHLAGGDDPVPDAGEKPFNLGLLLLSIGLAFVWLFVAVIINIILHEAGHLLFGLLTGYRFVSFRIFKFTLTRENGHFHWKRFHISGTGGQCIMALPENQDPDRAPWFWYNAGGVLLNLAVVVLSVVMLRMSHPGVVMLSFWLMMAVVALYMLVVNGIPMSVGGVSNDARNILLLWRHPEMKRYFVNTLQMVGQQSQGVRLKDMKAEWITDEPLRDPANTLELMNRGAYMSRLEDEGRLQDALAVGEEMLSFGLRLPQLFQIEVGSETVMLLLMTGGDRNRVEQLWTKSLEKYVRSVHQYSPVKCAVLYAYELFWNHDAEAAEKYSSYLQQHQDDFTMPGEAKTALFLVSLMNAHDDTPQ